MTKNKLNFIEIDRVRMEPDVYSGPNLDQHRPRWIVSIPKEGDEEIGDTLEISAKNHPPGTEVIIKEPVCPKCGEIYENCMSRIYNNSEDECDFDWNKLAEELYS